MFPPQRWPFWDATSLAGALHLQTHLLGADTSISWGWGDRHPPAGGEWGKVCAQGWPSTLLLSAAANRNHQDFPLTLWECQAAEKEIIRANYWKSGIGKWVTATEISANACPLTTLKPALSLGKNQNNFPSFNINKTHVGNTSTGLQKCD